MTDPLDVLKPSSLAEARKARGLTRAALAKLSGVDVTTIFRVENGQDPGLAKTWAPLVDALRGVPVAAQAKPIAATGEGFAA
jgi:transcriptional regulator with XRE-family HTH domain